MSSRAAEPLVGCLLGQALGDALGFVVEAWPPETARGYVEGWLRAGRAGERGHPDFPFGQYSDDTQLARELLLSLRDAGGWSPPAFAGRVARLFAAAGDVGAGAGTRGTALRLLAGVPWREAATPAPYAGNGSAMRAGPVGALYRDDEALLRRIAAEQSLVTHADPRCAAGAIAVAGAVALAARPGPVVPAGFLDTLAGWVAEADAGTAAALRGVADWLDLTPEGAIERLHRSGLEPASRAGWRGVSAYVLPSVAWSLYAFLRSPEDYWEAVCTAIMAGGDTDTMAAIAGAVAGARLGADALPRPLLARLTDRGSWGAEELAALARSCAALRG